MTAWSFRRGARALAATALWRMPGRFAVARILGRSYSLRCVVFHDISAGESPFTRGMGVSITPAIFETALKFLARNYAFVSLEDVLADKDGRRLPPRAVLVTFDDGYASVMDSAVPLCRKYGVPAVFFLNASVLDNYRLAPDNLVCYAANVSGMPVINAAARAVKRATLPELRSPADVFSRLFPAISLAEREVFLEALANLGEINQSELAAEAGLYLTAGQLRHLASDGFGIGNHTYTHVRCASLTPEDFPGEIGRNKSQLEAVTGRQVRSFSVPYGSFADLTRDLANYLAVSGHQAVFLSESAANLAELDHFHIDRVSIHGHAQDAFFLEIEVLPRLRAIRNGFRQKPQLAANSNAAECSTMRQEIGC